ncbi:MAG: TraR/DksA family transcriptional regulator [Bacteroidaceae bacterium]|nr:TraR/DksA family transcriptional regulator [Bacteroidaceae bacterium]
MAEQQVRYSDEELEEFRQIVLDKLAIAEEDYAHTMDAVMNRDNNEADDTAPTYHSLEEGSEVQTKGQLMAMAVRQQKFIAGLKAALIRIDNKTYGICRETGKLIPKERLRAVPHATLSIEVKNDRKRHH